MLLSIGMIVKNEERYLSRCLTALSPILAQVESELIIADTGSTDNTVEIAKEFTKNVFLFDWCDDFSAARNSTMRKAKGSWFFSIDADEVLTDTKGLIDFFNSGEYKKFNAASITIRSGNDVELKKWIELQTVRLIKLQNDSFFINAIHEKFGHIYEPIKSLPITANHYGYVTEGNEEYIDYKMNRNLKMVLAELDSDPSNCMLYQYASDIYNMTKDYDKAMEYCKKGLTCAKKQNNPLQYIFSAKAVSLYSNMGCYAKAIEASDEYFRSKQERLGTDLEVCYLKAESCFLLGSYHDAILCYKDYFEEYKQAQYKNAADILRHPVVCADGVSYRIAILRMAKANMEEGDYKSALAYLRSLTAADYQSDRDNITYWLDMEIGIMKKTGDFSGIIDLYGQLDAVSREVFQALIEREMSYPANRDSIIKVFTAYRDTKEAYLWLLKLRSEYYDGSLTAESVQDFLSSMTVLTPLFADTIYFAVKAGLPLASFTQKVDPLDIGRFFYFNTAYHFTDLAYLVYGGYGEGIDTDAGIQMWLSSLYYMELTAGRLREEYAAGMFKAYAKSTFNAMTELFKEEMLQEGNLQLLPRQFRAGYYCYMAVNALDAGKDSEYIRYLRTILKHCPQMGKIVKLLAEQTQINTEVERQSEFEAYANKVKSTIHDLINSGNFVQASELIQTYESISPADPEIAAMKKRTIGA